MHWPHASSHLASNPSAFAVDKQWRLAATDRFEIMGAGDDESHDEAVKLAAAVCATPAAILSFTDRGRQRLTARFGLDALDCPRALFFCAQAIRAPDRLMIVPDVAEDPRFARKLAETGGGQLRFYAGAPLVSPQGAPFGMISVLDRTTRQLTDNQAAALGNIARQLVRQLTLGRENTALRAANAVLAEMSLTDALTGIANRRAFNERLAEAEARARQTGEPLSLLLMDVDHFKGFNDRYGHPTGDEALVRIATTLKRSNRATDLLAALWRRGIRTHPAADAARGCRGGRRAAPCRDRSCRDAIAARHHPEHRARRLMIRRAAPPVSSPPRTAPFMWPRRPARNRVVAAANEANALGMRSGV